MRVPAATRTWWMALCAAALLNAAMWIVSAWWLAPDAAVQATRHTLLWLSAVYVAGCAFRSVLPMLDVQRYCLHATPISRIFVGRSVATVAELAFVGQWAFLMQEAGATRAAFAVVAIIVVAEMLSWLAVLTRNDLFHAGENALWTMAAALAALFLSSRWSYENEVGRQVIGVAIIGAAVYAAFMVAYVVPMYLGRWQPGAAYLSPAQGLRQVLRPCTVERRWTEWWQDAAWLTPYFTICVWISIALAHVPSLKNS